MERQCSDKFFGDIIMSRERHQIIYGYNGEVRKQFLKNMVSNYPIRINESVPMGVYMDQIGLPVIPEEHPQLDRQLLYIFSREYLNFSIAQNLLTTTLEGVDENDLTERKKEFFRMINILCADNKLPALSSLKELRDILTAASEVYRDEYLKYTQTGYRNPFIDKMPIPFLQLNFFIEYFKELLNTTSYFGVVFDHQEQISVASQKAINSLISYRINADISVKLACDPENWKTYCAMHGVPIEYIHDYGIEEFDDSFKKYIKKQNEKHMPDSE